MMASKLSGKSAIVTGAGGGICFAYTRMLLENGANVVLADLALRAEAQECVERYQDTPKAIFIKTDVSSWKDLNELFRRAEEAFGVIDIVCPGAGLFEPSISNFWIPPGSAESRDDLLGDRYKTVDVNITHPIRLTQMAMAHFMASEPKPSADNIKIVIHTVSMACETPYLPFPMYIATKFALHGFISSLAGLDHELGIRVVGVAPGATKTPLWTESKEKRNIIHKDGVMVEGWITPEQVAERMFNLTVAGEMISIDDGSPIEVKGGLVLEVGATHVRPIPILNNTGPPRDLPAGGVLNHQAQIDDTWARVKTQGWGKF